MMGPVTAAAMLGSTVLRALLLLLVVVPVTVVACGDDADPAVDDDGNDDDDDDDDGDGSSTTSTGGVTAATIDDACQGMSNYYEVCYDDSAFDVAGCTAADACFALVYRDDAEQPMLDCFAGWATSPTCDDWCSDQVAPTLTPAPEHTAHEASCAAYENDCGQSAGDVCRNPVVQLEPALVAEITACLDGECAALDDCLDMAVDDYLAPCGGDTGGLW